MPSIEVRMLRPLSVSRHGTALALPGSRKVRGLLAYLLLSPHPVQRSSYASCYGTFPTIRAGSCAGASARSEALSMNLRGRGSTPAATL